MFGWGEVGTAGVPEDGEDGGRPGLRSFAPGIRLLAAGLNVLLLVKEPGKMVVIRTNHSGDGTRVQGKQKPVKCEQQVQAASCSDDAVMLLCEGGALLSVDATVRHVCPRPVPALSGKRVRQVACGSHHSIALTADGHLYTWGQDGRGQLGLGKGKSGASSPQPLRALGSVAVVQVSAGGQQSFALTASGAVFGWGGNHRGQLGMGDTADRHTPTKIHLLSRKKTTHIACGEEHTAILTKDGAVFTFGSGQFGQLGHNSHRDEPRPRLVGELWGANVIKLACGRHHTLVLTDSGRVYSFGRGEEGQLGRQEPAHSSVPLLVQLPQDSTNGLKFTNIYAGGNVSFATSDGVVDQGSMDGMEAVVTKCCLEDKIELWTSACDTKITKETQMDIKTTFSSAFCANQSFLDRSHDKHFQTSLSCSGLDLTLASGAFSKLARHHHVLLEVVAAVKQLLPTLEKEAVGEEGLRVYLLLSELLHAIQKHAPPPHSATLAQELAQTLAQALRTLSPDALHVIVSWWSSMSPLTLLRHVSVWRTALCHVLSLRSVCRIPVNNVILILQSLYQANNTTEGRPKIPNTAFSLEFEDSFLEEDLRCWRSVSRNEHTKDQEPLIICRFPFLMNLKFRKLAFDRNVLWDQEEYDPEQYDPDEYDPMDFFWGFDQQYYLELHLTRSSLFEEAFEQLDVAHNNEFKSRLKVFLDNDENNKGFFHYLFHDMVSKKPSMFFFNESTKLAWFSSKATDEDKESFLTFGVLCGMAMCNNTIMHLPVPLVLFKKLLNMEPSLEDMKEFDPTVAKSLQDILDNQDNSVEDLLLDFVIYWENSAVDLDPQNPGKPVTSQNKKEFVEAYVNYAFNASVESVFQEFRRGFFQVCDEEMVQLFEPRELQEILVGKELYDWSKLKQNTQYESGYDASHPTILMLWEVFDDLTEEQKKDFLLLVTGFRTVPLLGMDRVRIQVKQAELCGSPDDYFPWSQTCFSLLFLPAYSTKEIMQTNLTMALHRQGKTS